MIDTPLNDNTFLLHAMHHYDKTQCISISEFEEDLKRFSYVKKLLNRYEEGELKERLILNHIIILHNIFGVIAVDFLFLKTDVKHWGPLMSFLLYLNLMPESIPDLGVSIHDINPDPFILQRLRNL